MKNSFVLLILVAFTSLFLLSPGARGQSDVVNSVELLSYSELMQLPVEKRTLYIEGVREILVDLAKRSDGKFSDRDPATRSRLKAWLEMLDREMKAARAAESESSDEVAPAPKRQVPSEPIGDASAHSRSPALSSKLSIVPHVNESDTIATFVGRDNLDVRHFKCVSTNRSASPEGSIGLPACSADVEALIQKRFDDGKSALALREVSPTSPIQLRAPTETSATAKVISKVAISRPISMSEITSYLDRKENPNKICEAEAAKAGGEPMDLVSIDGTQDHFCMTKEAEAQYSAGKLPVRDRRAAVAAAPKARGEERKYSCAPKPEVCEVPKSAASKIFKGGQTCVFAGMLSVFNSGNTRCQPKTEFALGDKKYKCASGQTMCNPLLFGTVSSTTPICIGHAPNATEQCSRLSSSRDAEKFLNRAENGLQEKWNEFRKALAETCKPKSDSAKFHCEECNIMKTRIFDLQARLLQNPCGGGRSDDGDHAIDLRIKLGGPKSSGTKR